MLKRDLKVALPADLSSITGEPRYIRKKGILHVINLHMKKAIITKNYRIYYKLLISYGADNKTA
jgi:hypothetical protein